MKKTTAPLAKEEIAKLDALRGGKPAYLFAQQLGLSPQATANALAGLPLYAGTRALIGLRLKELTSANAGQVEGAAA